MTRVNVHDTLDTSVMMIGFNWIVRENANSADVSMPCVYALRAWPVLCKETEFHHNKHGG